MKNNEYQIKTIQDIIESTNLENLDDFLTDLKGVLIMAHTLNVLANKEKENKEHVKNLIKLKKEGFKWIDDGKHNIDVTLSPYDTEE